MLRFLPFLLTTFSVIFLQAQEDLMRPLRAKGPIPADFTNYTIEKINAEEHNHSEEFLALSRKQQRHFLNAVHQGIDEILRSGKVLFGDTLTNYVNAVGRKILGDDPELQHIRFYTLKSNVVNAFSTNQGIIFVSQGLLAQVKNEAQLAFVLAHELAHYTERHVIVGFKENIDLMTSKKSISEKVKRYSIYSKDKEYEADRIGVKLYNRAGYNLEDLYSVFDLLTFSYLPFDSKKVAQDYFNSALFYLPPSFFKVDLPKVSPDDDADDSRSTHPNIKSRRNQLSGEIPKYDSWQDNSTLTSQDAFEFARSIARMEQIRNDLYEFDYIAALYNVYLLEDDLNGNIYFNQYKAQTWLGLLIFKTFSRFSDISAALTRIQGEQHQMHHVIRALNRRQLATLAIRQIYDIRTRFPNDELIEEVYQKAIINLTRDERFRLKDFHSITYTEALKKFGPSVQPRESSQDTSALTSSQLAIERSKLGMNAAGQINDSDFYRFGLSDLIQDEEFKRSFEAALKKKKAYLDEEESTESKKKKRKIPFVSRKKAQTQKVNEEQKRMRSGIDRVILFEPRGVASRNFRQDIVESEQLEIGIKSAFENLQVDFMEVIKIGSKELKGADADAYNEKAVLMNTLTQLLEYKELQLFPVDFHDIQSIRKKYQTDKVAFIVLENNRLPFQTKLAAASLITTFPLFAVAAQKNAERFTFSLILFDLKTYSIDGVMRYKLHGQPSASAIEALSYNMLQILHAEKIVSANE